mmetsp:Transcript_9157/g.23740  ORF Transcript_9157/g.23740 Transcript_9157/m.23740 type:complete len:201 (-) Transcript_9157:171-773(-)
MATPRLCELLKRFKLPPQATQAELRKAYYKTAKLIHPDVAGEDSAEEFRKLKEAYEEAAEHMQEAEETPHYQRGPSASSSGPRYRSNWNDPSGQWSPHAFGGHFYGDEGFREGGKMRFDPRAVREGNASHRMQQKDGGYTYEASGSSTTAGAARQADTDEAADTPARRFRRALVISATVFGGVVLSTRIGRSAVNERSYA